MVCGGYDGEKVLNSCEIYDINSQKWTSISDMNTGRMYFNGTLKKDLVYVIGGINDKEEILNHIEYLDLKDLKWH